MKSVYSLLVLLVSLNVLGQHIDFNIPRVTFNYVLKNDVFKNNYDLKNDYSFDFSKQYDLILFDNQEQHNLNLLSVQMVNESLFASNKKYQYESFLNHCGPLKDGLYLPVKGEEAVVSNFFDNLINKELLPKLIFNK